MIEGFETESERRKAFIERMRAQNAALTAGFSDERSVHVLDARKCSGVVKDKVVAALGERLDRLKAESASTPMRLSRAALKACGISDPAEASPAYGPMGDAS